MFENFSQNQQNNFSSPGNSIHNHAPQQRPQNNQIKPASKPKSKKKNLLSIYIISAILAIIILVIIIIVIIRPWDTTNNGDVPTQDLTTTTGYTTTEEEDQVTKQTLTQYADIKIEGYKTVEDESGTYDALVVTVKNISNESIHVAADIVAKDQNGEILDEKSIYAEGLEPDQSYTFNIFTNSELSKEQLQNSTFEILRAFIYTKDESETPAEVITETTDAPSEATESSSETIETTPETNGTNINNSNQ